MVNPVIVTCVPGADPQMSTTSWLGWAPPSVSQEVTVSDGVAGSSRVTAPRALMLTDWVMASCSWYVPAHTRTVAPAGATARAAEMELNPGLVQLLLVPTGSEFDTHSIGVLGTTARAAAGRRETCRAAREVPTPKGDTCLASTCGRA